MKAGDVFHVAPGTIHRMIAVTDVDVLEVSTPELDDVVRLEDVYGREGTSKP
jgi:quercetin dioxygenase-like cupin family protein